MYGVLVLDQSLRLVHLNYMRKEIIFWTVSSYRRNHRFWDIIALMRFEKSRWILPFSSSLLLCITIRILISIL